METNGSLELSGITAMLGEIFPREVGDAFEKVPETSGSPDPTSTLDEPKVSDEDEDPELEACLAFNVDPEEAVGSVADVKVAEALEEKLDAPVEEASSFGIEAGMATGQNDQTFLPESQYKSSSNLRKPTASRLERQAPELSSSYLKRGKQAACKETPGDVT